MIFISFPQTNINTFVAKQLTITINLLKLTIMIKVIRIYQDAKITELYVNPNCNYDLDKNDNGLILVFPFDSFIKKSDSIIPINHSDLINNNHINVVNNTVVITHIDDINFEYRFINPNDNARDVL